MELLGRLVGILHAAGDTSWIFWILESLLGDPVAEGACEGKGCGEWWFCDVVVVTGAFAC